MTAKKRVKRDPEFMRKIASKGGKARSKSEKAFYPFRDVPGLAKKAGSTKGYNFKRKSSDNEG